MRIEIPRELERFGANLFYGVQKVYELDSGLKPDEPADHPCTVKQLSYEQLYEIEKDMVIVIPTKGEKLRLLQGVLYGIPHQCLIIVVSNSPRQPVDRFSIEKDAIERFCTFTRKSVLVIHQEDPALAKALESAGYPELLDERGTVKSGKGEGMLLATLLARLTGKKFIGFIDADNYFPGAVLEYIRIYSAGFALRTSDYALVRISWQSKPKVMGSGLYFAKYGRASVITNRFMNSLVGYTTGFETEVIRTGNAGEHALTLDLAMLMEYASGYAVEPYHLIYLMETFGGLNHSLQQDIIQKHIEIFQIESRNPHLHEQKGDEHVEDMIFAALQVIYHSPVTPKVLKKEILEELRSRGSLKKDQEPPKMSFYPPLGKVNLKTFRHELSGHPCAAFFAPVSAENPLVREHDGKRSRKKTGVKAHRL